MSIENHPNVYAVQLAIDVVEALQRATRGNAAHDKNLIDQPIKNMILRFVHDVSEHLDQRYGT